MSPWKSLKRSVSGVFSKTSGDITAMDVKMPLSNNLKFKSSSSPLSVDLTNCNAYIARSLPPLPPIEVLPWAANNTAISSSSTFLQSKEIANETANKRNTLVNGSRVKRRESFHQSISKCSKNFKSLLADRPYLHFAKILNMVKVTAPPRASGAVTEDVRPSIEPEGSDYDDFIFAARDWLDDDSFGALLYIWAAPTFESDLELLCDSRLLNVSPNVMQTALCAGDESKKLLALKKETERRNPYFHSSRAKFSCKAFWLG